MNDFAKYTTRELASKGHHLLKTLPYAEAKKQCEPIKQEINRRLKELSDKTNKALGTHRKPPQVKVLSDFGRFL